MVMLRRILTLIAILCCQNAIAANTAPFPQLLLSLKKTEVQLGRSIAAELIAVNLSGKLSSIDLRPLYADFGVIVLENEEDVDDARWPGQNIDKMLLKLYPRKMGTLSVPRLQLNGQHTGTTSIQCHEGAIKQQMKISQQQAWERQQIIISMELQTPDRFASLSSEENPLIPGFEVVQLPIEKQPSSSGKGTSLQITWALFPLTDGTFQLELPPVDYRKSGRSERSYYLPQQSIEVRPLPPYIPPTMPVGKVSITSHISEPRLLNTNELNYWDIRLAVSGQPPQWLPSLTQQIKSDDAVRFLSASSERSSVVTNEGIEAEVLFQVPFKAMENGRLELPPLELQYFDPETGKIAKAIHQAQAPYVLSTTWRMVFLIAAGSALFALVTVGVRKIRHRVACRRKRRALIKAIKDTSHIVALRQQLEKVAELEGWRDNLCIRDWLRLWTEKYKLEPEISQFAAKLSEACYSAHNDVDVQTYGERLALHLRQAWGL